MDEIWNEVTQSWLVEFLYDNSPYSLTYWSQLFHFQKYESMISNQSQSIKENNLYDVWEIVWWNLDMMEKAHRIKV